MGFTFEGVSNMRQIRRERLLSPRNMAGMAVLVCVGVLVVGVLGIWRGGKRSNPATDAQRVSATPVLLVEAVNVHTESVQAENTVSGQVEPYHIATVAAEVANRVTSRPIALGDHVSAAALLVSLDTEAARTALQ